MIEQVRDLLLLDEEGQARYFHARDRRRSLAGVADLFRTNFIDVIPTATVPGASFPAAVRSAPVTFLTAIRITSGSTHKGLIFELGSSTAGIAAWLEDDRIGVTAGSGVAAASNAVTDTFVISGGLPNTLELDLVIAVSPHDGELRVWANGDEIIRATSQAASLLNGEWSDSGDGSFAAAPSGTVALNVPATSRVVPDGFDVILPLSAYAKQKPRHFL